MLQIISSTPSPHFATIPAKLVTQTNFLVIFNLILVTIFVLSIVPIVLVCCHFLLNMALFNFDPAAYKDQMVQDCAVVTSLARDEHVRAAQIALDSQILRDLFPENVVHRFTDSVLANRTEARAVAGNREAASRGYVLAVKPMTDAFHFIFSLVKSDQDLWVQDESAQDTKNTKYIVVGLCLRIFVVVHYGFAKFRSSESTIRRKLELHNDHGNLMTLLTVIYRNPAFQVCGCHTIRFRVIKHQWQHLLVSEFAVAFIDKFCSLPPLVDVGLYFCCRLLNEFNFGAN